MNAGRIWATPAAAQSLVAPSARVRVCTPCGATSDRARFYPGIRGCCAGCWREAMRRKRQTTKATTIASPSSPPE